MTFSDPSAAELPSARLPQHLLRSGWPRPGFYLTMLVVGELLNGTIYWYVAVHDGHVNWRPGASWAILFAGVCAGGIIALPLLVGLTLAGRLYQRPPEWVFGGVGLAFAYVAVGAMARTLAGAVPIIGKGLSVAVTAAILVAGGLVLSWDIGKTTAARVWIGLAFAAALAVAFVAFVAGYFFCAFIATGGPQM